MRERELLKAIVARSLSRPVELPVDACQAARDLLDWEPRRGSGSDSWRESVISIRDLPGLVVVAVFLVCLLTGALGQVT